MNSKYVPLPEGESELSLCQFIHSFDTCPLQSPLSQVAINQLFRKFDAFEFSQLGILFLPAVERQADLPRPRKNSTVIDGRFVTDVIGVGQRITLHDVNVLCHEITGSVEPTLAVQSGYIHNQGVTFPVTIRCSHPRIDGSLAPLSHIDHTVGCRIFVSDSNVVLRLNDLKRVRHVGGARHSGHVAFHFRIQFHPVRKVLLLFRCRFRFIWNLTVLDDALASGDRADRTELVKRARLGTVVPDVPICGSQSLPETSEIWFAIRHSWYSRSLGLSWCGNGKAKNDDQSRQPATHQSISSLTYGMLAYPVKSGRFRMKTFLAHDLPKLVNVPAPAFVRSVTCPANGRI